MANLRKQADMTDAIPCAFDPCDRPARAAGLCHGHYRQRRLGKTMTPLRQVFSSGSRKPPAERLAERSIVTAKRYPHLEKPCIEWTGTRNRRGYGQISVDGKFWTTHRLAHYLATGETPLLVRHHCDNPPCIEPTHLASGDHADNAADREKRGRGRPPRGESAGSAKLTWAAVREIRQGKELGYVLAKKYGVSKATISLVRNGHVWKE